MLGFPTAFTLMGLGIVLRLHRLSTIRRRPGPTTQVFDLMVQRTYGAMTNDVLISIPLFVLMGYVMERGALVDKMFYSIQLAFRNVPASLAVATLIVCTFWGIASGLVGAVVVLMGVIAFNPMLRAGYDVQARVGRHHRRRHARHPDPAVGHDHRLCGGRRAVGGQALCRGDVPGLLPGAASISSISSAGR
jgi:TRAP-type mannitol/chloroaromatic compound transport system permease large subunit